MKHYDFIFVYEVKNRELENICLLRYELERRGYSVAFIETWDHLFHAKAPLSTSVVISFALYNDDTINYIMSFVQNCNKIVNLQWEQVFTNGDFSSKKENSSSGVFGKAKEAVHISWGKQNYETLRQKYDVSPHNLCITGQIALDFLRPELRNYYLSREDILLRYNISTIKKVCLFISSLSYVDMPQNVINSPLYQNQGFDVSELVDISTQTQKKLIEWFEHMLSEHNDYVLVYRPHPAEMQSDLLQDVAKRCPNFFVISDLSVKQWILIADNIYTWWSTSVAEIHAAKKPYGILRPVAIPYDMELQNYNGAQFITDYESFAASLNTQTTSPISSETMEEFYHIDPEKPAFIQVADLLERVYHDDSYCISGIKKSFSHMSFHTHILNLWNVFFQRNHANQFGRAVLRFLRPRINAEGYIESYHYNFLMKQKNHSSPKEVNAILQRINDVLSASEM